MPQNYWVNTSSNSIIRKFIDRADATARDEVERLISGGSIYKKIHQELTYRDLDAKMDHLWSVLFTTGYLTQRGKDKEGLTKLAIPNREIGWIFEEQIQEWFEWETKRDAKKREEFCLAFEENDTAFIEKNHQHPGYQCEKRNEREFLSRNPAGIICRDGRMESEVQR